MIMVNDFQFILIVKKIQIYNALNSITDNIRHLVVHKIPEDDHPYICLTEDSIDAIEILDCTENPNLESQCIEHRKFTTNVKLTVPPKSNSDSSMNLPASQFRKEILDKINNNKVIVVSGETGTFHNYSIIMIFQCIEYNIIF